MSDDMPLQGFDARGAWVIKHLMADLDLTAEQAAGIVGNLGGESGLAAIQERNPIAGAGGFGWAQWTGPRREAFGRWCDDHHLSMTSDAANYGFLLEELRNEQAHSLEQLKKTTTVDAATYTFEVYFERPSDPEGGKAPRIAFAKRALAAYSTQAVRIPPRPAPPPASQPVPPHIPMPPPQQPAVIAPPSINAIQGAAVTGTAGMVGAGIAWWVGYLFSLHGIQVPIEGLGILAMLLTTGLGYLAHWLWARTHPAEAIK